MKKILLFSVLVLTSLRLFSMMPADLDSSTNGSLNPFNTDGYQLLNEGSSERFHVVDMDSNNKIIAIGQSGGQAIIARFDSDGSLDTGFSGDGKYFNNQIGSQVHGGVDSNNKIIAGGRNGSNSYEVTIVKILEDGSSLDTGFGNVGEATFPINGTDSINISKVLVDANDKIVVIGYYGSTSIPFVARVLADGSALDTTFNGTGIIKETSLSDDSSSVLYRDGIIDSQGRIVAAGEYNGTSGRETIIARYTTTGGVESGFGNRNSIVGTGGIIVHNFASSTSGDVAPSVSVNANDDIIVAGIAYYFGWRNYIAQFLESDGSLDTGNFNSGGSPAGINYFYINGSQYFQEYTGGVTVDSAGKIVVVGDVSLGEEAIVRFNADGTFDTGFGVSGEAYNFDGLYSLNLYDVMIQPNGKIVFLGSEGSDNQLYIGRMFGDEVVVLPSDGDLDTNFGVGGELNLAGTASLTTTSAPGVVHIAADGSIFIAGQNGTDVEIAKLTSGHVADGTFNAGSKVTLGTAFWTRAMMQTAGGDIVVCGGNGTSGSNEGWIFKIDASGNSYPMFNVVENMDIAFKVVEQSTGRLIVAGIEDGVATLLAYNPVSGAVDTSFGGAGTGRYTVTGITNPIVDIAVVDGTDELLIAYVDGSNNAQVKKLQPNATAEASGFTFGTAVGSVVAADQLKMRLLSDGKIAVVAPDNSSNFVARRYAADGSDDVGLVTINVANLSDLADILPLSDGNLVLLGADSSSNMVLARLSSSFALDSTFGTSGISVIDAATMTFFIAIDVQADNSLLVAGI